ANVAVSGHALPVSPAGIVTCQLNVAQPPPSIFATEAGAGALTVQPAGAFSDAVTPVTVAPSAGTASDAEAVNVCPARAPWGPTRVAFAPGGGGNVNFGGS